MAQLDIKQIRGGSQGSVLFLGTNSVVSENINNLSWNNSTNTFNINGNFKYVDGNQQSGYVLVSDAIGNASWTSSVGSLSATNGVVQFSPGVIGLGGTLSQNTNISADSFDFGISNFETISFSGSSGSVVDIQLEGGLFLVDTDAEGNIELYAGEITLYSSGNVDIITTDEFSINTSTGSVTTTNLEGLVYTDDYYSTFVTHSLVDKNYVDLGTSSIWSEIYTLGTGNISGVTAGSGLTGGGSSSFITLDVNVNSDSLEIAGDYVRLKDIITGDRTFQDSVLISGNLTVNGTASYINTQTLLVEDNIITLNSTFSGSPFLDSGIEVKVLEEIRKVVDEEIQLAFKFAEETPVTDVTEAMMGTYA
jgi:hypothetical protein